MSLQSSLYTLLASTFSNRIYPSVAPFGVATPYATYTRVTALEQNTLDANGGTGNTVNTLVQIDIWSTTYLEASTKAAAVKTLLKGWAMENVVTNEQDGYEPDTTLYRVILEISVWHL